jgi:hypothetical protein
MSEPMTLEEAVRVLREQRDFALDDTQRHPSLAQWFAERTQAIAIVAAHAERTIAARSGEPEEVQYVRSRPLFYTERACIAHIDTLTADLARVTAANAFARTEWAIWEEKACELERERKAVEAERDAARERSEYWKAEHAAANEVIDTITNERDAARKERDFLVGEYELALRIEPRGFAHAAGHIYNAIANAQFEANWKQSETIRADRDRLAACVKRVRAACERADHWVEKVDGRGSACYVMYADILAALGEP